MTWLFDALWTSVCCGAAAVLLTLLTPLLQKRYSARMRCWVWIAIAVFLLVPVRPDFGAAPIKVNVPETFTRTITLRQPQSFSAPQSGVQTAAPQSGESAATEPETPVTNETQAAQESPVGGESADQTTQPQTGNVQNTVTQQTPDTAPAGGDSAQDADAPSQTEAKPSARPAVSITLGQAVLAVWAIGALVLALARTLPYLLWKRRVLRRSRPLTNPALRSYCAQAKRRTGCKARVTVRVSADADTPMVVGALRPVLLLPPGLAADNTTALMLVHEYMHVRRRDVLAKSVVFAAACVHWFNPAVYLMLHGISRDAELACDEAVLTLCGEQYRGVYGRALVAGVGKRAAFTTQFGGGKRAVKQRLEALFLGVRRRGVLTAAALVAVVACATVLVACQTGQTGKGGASAMVSRPLDTAIPVAQTEIPTVSFPLEMWEVEGDSSFMYEGEIYEQGYGTYLTLQTADGVSLLTPVRRSDVDDSRMDYDGTLPENALVVWVGNGVLNAAVTEDGENWAQTVIADIPGAENVKCSRVDADTMYAAVQAGGTTTIYRTDDSGASWRQAGSRVEHALVEIYFFESDAGVFCAAERGDTGPIVLYTSDGGNTWTESQTPDMTQAFDMTRVRALRAKMQDGTLYLQTESRYKEEIPDEGEQYGSFIYILESTDGGASWNYRPRSEELRRALTNVAANRMELYSTMYSDTLVDSTWNSDGSVTYYVTEGAQVPSLLNRGAVVAWTGNGEVELRVEETEYNRETTVRYSGLSDVTVSVGDVVASSAEIGTAGASERAGTGSYSVTFSSGGQGVSMYDVGSLSNVNKKSPPLCEVPEELREYAERAGGNRAAVAYTLANALLQGDENAVDNLVFGQYAQSHSFDSAFGQDAYALESLEGFACTGAWIDVEGEGEDARVLLTLEVENAGATGLMEGLNVYVVESRADSSDSAWPADTVCTLMPISYEDTTSDLSEELQQAVEMVREWRTWCSREAFSELNAEDLPYQTEIYLALMDRYVTGKTEWSREDISVLAAKYLGVEGYVPSESNGPLSYNAQSGMYTIPEIGAGVDLTVTSWDAVETENGAQVICTLFADGLGCVPSYRYIYELEANEGGFALRSCSVESVSKLYFPEVPVTGEALSDDRARSVCRSVLDNAQQLRAWMFGTARRVDETDTVQRVQDGVSVAYGRSLDFDTPEECAESLGNVISATDPLSLTGTATRISDGQPFEISLCTEENGKLYTAQAYCIDPYQAIDTQAVKLDYVSDEKITFTVPATLQSGESVTVHYTVLAEDGRWVLESLSGTVESR